jgi:hypothetical protein
VTSVARLSDWVARVLILLFIIAACWAVATLLSGGSYQ